MANLNFDKMPVGKGERKEMFSEFSFDWKEGDQLYLFTDGYADQFGGDKGKKFMIKNLRELLLKASVHPLEEQQKILESTFDNWKGQIEQVDDVSVIGIVL